MELRAVLWVLWPQATDDKIIDTLYDLIDEDGSGRILEDEFVSQMTRLTAEVKKEKQKARADSCPAACQTTNADLSSSAIVLTLSPHYTPQHACHAAAGASRTA